MHFQHPQPPTQTTANIQISSPSQSVATSQVVSVSQLTGVGTVFTTSGLGSNAVATLTTSSLRPQRIVTAPALQEMMFNQRTGSQSPTVVSVSGLTSQSVSQAQLQTGQLRLSMGGNQQMSGVVTKGGIPISAITAAGKPINAQQAQFQILRQNASRQQFKVVNTPQGNTVLQTVGGQVSVVNPSGAIIQGGLVTGSNVGQTLQLQQAGGQKVSIATVSGVSGSPGMVTNVASVATVQMTGTGQQQRAHFMKQMGTKQQIGRPVTETEMLLVKRQMINQAQAQGSPQQQQASQVSQQKAQILSQFTPSIQLQQTSGVGGQQHIATLVKTSSGAMATSGGTVGMTLAQIKPGQLKATLPNASTPVRQMQLQQIPIAQQQRKTTGKMTQITQVANTVSTSSAGGSVTGTVSGVTKGSPVGTAQLIVQNPKNLQPGTVTVQQIQQVMRQSQPSQIVLGKSVGRIIPVSVSSQPNARQTIQVIFPNSSKSQHKNFIFHLHV